MKYAWIEAHRQDYELTEMCDMLLVSHNGYRAWKEGGSQTRKRLTDAQMLALIEAIHAELKGTYGSPRMVRELRHRGIPASKKRVERLMRDNDIRARHKRRYKATTNSRHTLPVAPNLLERNFQPAAPNQAWSADLTYIWTDEGWLYLATILDLFNREIVGWSMKPTMATDIVLEALAMAWFHRRPPPGLIHHSDRGSQYASYAFQARLKEYGMVCSMSRKGNCWDNAPAESFFNSLKNERVHNTRYHTRDEARADLFDYIELFYNRKRRHSTLGYVSPKAFLEAWRRRQTEMEERYDSIGLGGEKWREGHFSSPLPLMGEGARRAGEGVGWAKVRSTVPTVYG